MVNPQFKVLEYENVQSNKEMTVAVGQPSSCTCFTLMNKMQFQMAKANISSVLFSEMSVKGTSSLTNLKD